MADKREVPAWLLQELNLIDGVFGVDRTTVIGPPNGYLGTVLNVGGGSPPTTTVYLKKFPEALKKLANEGRACPLCGFENAWRTDVAVDGAQQFKDCPTCKKYKISDSFHARIMRWRAGADDHQINEKLLTKLSTDARQASERGELLLINPE